PAMLATSSLTFESAGVLGGGPGAGAGGITFSGIARDATTALRTSRPLCPSARTTVVTRFAGAAGVAPRTPIAISAMQLSLKQNRIILFKLSNCSLIIIA